MPTKVSKIDGGEYGFTCISIPRNAKMIRVSPSTIVHVYGLEIWEEYYGDGTTEGSSIKRWDSTKTCPRAWVKDIDGRISSSYTAEDIFVYTEDGHPVHMYRDAPTSWSVETMVNTHLLDAPEVGGLVERAMAAFKQSNR